MIWFIMILTGVINFTFRISMFSGLRNIHLPLSLKRYVVYVPTSVLSAIIASSLISLMVKKFYMNRKTSGRINSRCICIVNKICLSYVSSRINNYLDNLEFKP